MATVQPDLIRDSRGKISTSGATFVRSIFVEDLNGDESARIAEAILACGVRLYQQHPKIAGCFAVDFDGIPLSDTKVLVLVTYESNKISSAGGGSEFLVEYDAALQNELTDTDLTGAQFQVNYWPKKADIGNPDKTKFRPQGAVVSAPKPYLTKLVTRYYTKPSAGDTQIKTWVGFIGKTNAATWDDGDAETWLCTNVHVSQYGRNSRSFKVVFQFVYKPEGWLAWAQYIEPTTGKAPQNSHKNKADPNQMLANTGSNGWRGLKVLGSQDYSTLGF